MERIYKSDYDERYIRLHRNEGNKSSEWNNYPDIEGYYKKFKDHLGYENIFFIEGVSGGIKNIMEVLRPSKISYDSDFALYPIFEDLFCESNGPTIQFIANPKTEIDIKYDHIVIDDVFNGYHKHSWDNLLPDVTILRSFSKAYGLAGLRIGYMTGELTERIAQYRGGYESNTHSLECAYKNLTEFEYQHHKNMREWKKALDYYIRADTYFSYDGYTNYVTTDLDYVDKLKENGILVKPLNKGMRITVTNLETAQHVIHLIRQWEMERLEKGDYDL